MANVFPELPAVMNMADMPKPGFIGMDFGFSPGTVVACIFSFKDGVMYVHDLLDNTGPQVIEGEVISKTASEPVK